MRHCLLVCLCAVALVAPAAAQLSEIEAFLNITINNIPANKINMTGINVTQLGLNLAALALSDPRFNGAVLNSIIQNLLSAGVTVQMCIMGTYSNAQTLTCVQCPAGTYSTQPLASSQSVCQLCGQGKYSTTLGASNANTCLPCPINTYSSAQGVGTLAQCYPCPANSTSSQGTALLSSCVCQTGFYQTGVNYTCSVCQAGSYCTNGQSLACPYMSSSPPGSSALTSCLCKQGYSGYPAQQYGACSTCTSGNYCPGNLLGGSIPCPTNSNSNYGATSLAGCTCGSGYQQLPYSTTTRTYNIPTASCACTNGNPCGTAVGLGSPYYKFTCPPNYVCGAACSTTPCQPNVLTAPMGYLQLYTASYYAPSVTQEWMLTPSIPVSTTNNTNTATFTSVTLTFTVFNTRLNYDFVAVYQCPDAVCSSSILLGQFSGPAAGNPGTVQFGTQSVPLPASVTASSGYMMVKWVSSSVASSYTGWQASYSSTTVCTPLMVQNAADGSTITGSIMAWTGDTLNFIAPNLNVEVVGAAVLAGSSNDVFWYPSTAGVYSLVDTIYPSRSMQIVVSPIAPTVWDIYVDINAADTAFVFSGPVTGTNPTLYLTIGDTLQLTRNSVGYTILLATSIGPNSQYTAMPNDAAGVVGQTTLRVTWNTTSWPAGTYYYAYSTAPTAIYGLIVLTPRPTGLTCQVCNVNDYCYNGNEFECPANSASTTQAQSAADCSCNAGFYTATTNMIAYVSSDTVDSGGRHSCVVTATQGLYCWGANEKGQLGLGYVSTTAAPSPVNITNVASVSLGDDFTCVLLVSGSVRCWGGNGYGQLGQGQTYAATNAMLPASLPNSLLGTLSVVSQLSCADYTCCVLFVEGIVSGMRCWGNGATAQLGYNSGGRNVGTNNYGTAPGTDFNNMGDGTYGMPVVSFGASQPIYISMGGSSGCAVVTGGNVMCWGSNSNGQIGAGTSATTVYGPATALLPGPAKSVSCYSAVCCAVLTSMSVVCWGAGANGRLGTGFFDVGTSADSMGINLPLVNLGSGVLVLDVSVGATQTCALLSNNNVKCWGLVNGVVLGANPVLTMSVYLPNVELETGRVAIEISGKEQSICAVLSDYSVACWGNNNYRQLGAAVPNVVWSSQSTAANPVINMSNMTLVPLPASVSAILSSGTPVVKTCAVCPANSYCTGANSGNFVGQCPTNSLSMPQSTSSSSCLCATGYQGGNTGSCTPCSGSIYCFGGAPYNCPANSMAGMNAWTVTNCTCLPGYTGANGAACTPCNPGYYKSTQGNASCSACPPGAASSGYAATSVSNCTACPGGWFAASGSLTCTPCQAGSAAIGGATACKPCTTGQYSLAQASVCTSCSPGTYNPTMQGTGPGSCVPCGAGKFSAAVGAISSANCTSCPAGSFSASNASACTQCLANSFSSAGSQSCTACPINASSPPGAGMTGCQCMAGFYPVSAVPAPYFTCSTCGTGKWSTPGNLTCNTCPAGTYQPNVLGNGSASCLPCAGGSAAVAGSPICTSCLIGSFSLQAAGTCTPCALGSWAAVGSTTCTTCLAGTFSTTAIGSQSACSPCTVGFYCPGGTQALPCPTGSYAAVGSYTSSSQCGPCPANSYCPTAYMKAPCPTGTSSVLGSTSQFACTCTAGYQCSYTKIVEAVVTLNMSFTQFNTLAVQQAFIGAVAAAANVAAGNVYIQSFQNLGNRRLLGLAEYAFERTNVFVGVRGADSLAGLDAHLLHSKLQPSLDHAWIAPHFVSVRH